MIPSKKIGNRRFFEWNELDPSTNKNTYEYSNLTYEAFDQYACRKPTDMQEHSFNMQAYWSNATYAKTHTSLSYLANRPLSNCKILTSRRFTQKKFHRIGSSISWNSGLRAFCPTRTCSNSTIPKDADWGYISQTWIKKSPRIYKSRR